jgi:hypothetical protein
MNRIAARAIVAAVAAAALAVPTLATATAGPLAGAETGNGFVPANGAGGDRPPPKK